MRRSCGCDAVISTENMVMSMTCERCGGLSIAMHFGDGLTWEYDG
jgi:hypothetical protein